MTNIGRMSTQHFLLLVCQDFCKNITGKNFFHFRNMNITLRANQDYDYGSICSAIIRSLFLHSTLKVPIQLGVMELYKIFIGGGKTLHWV